MFYGVITMKLFYKLFVGILAVIMTATVAFAQVQPAGSVDRYRDGGSVSILGEDRGISELFGESGLISFIKEKLEDLNLDGLISCIKDIFSEIIEKIILIIERIISAVVVNTDDSSYYEMLFAASSEIEAVKSYMLDKNAGEMDTGDIQIIYTSLIGDDDSDPENLKSLKACVQYNFTLDDKGQMHFISGAADIGLFILASEEDGSHTVKEAFFPEEGENYTSSLEALCSQVGVTVDDCLSLMEMVKITIIDELAVYYEEHPEITAIEFEGEMYNADQLREIEGERMNEIFERYQTEAE